MRQLEWWSSLWLCYKFHLFAIALMWWIALRNRLYHEWPHYAPVQKDYWKQLKKETMLWWFATSRSCYLGMLPRRRGSQLPSSRSTLHTSTTLLFWSFLTEVTYSPDVCHGFMEEAAICSKTCKTLCPCIIVSELIWRDLQIKRSWVAICLPLASFWWHLHPTVMTRMSKSSIHKFRMLHHGTVDPGGLTRALYTRIAIATHWTTKAERNKMSRRSLLPAKTQNFLDMTIGMSLRAHLR